MPSLIFRKGLGLKHAVADALAADYHSEHRRPGIRDSTYQYKSGRVTVYLARACGFCYGVDRAVDYAYQPRRRFPNRPVYLTGEIIHNTPRESPRRGHPLDGADDLQLTTDSYPKPITPCRH